MKPLRSFSLLLLVLFLLYPCIALATFSDDVEAMNEAAQSVVLLRSYDENDNDVATASGFIAFDSMTVVTNFHAIEGAYRIVAYDENDRSFDVPLLYCYDEKKDIAILRTLEDSGCMPLNLADSDAVRKGEKVTAIGSPLGLKNTLSTGIISGFDDTVGYQAFLFTAPISSGSSGGALFNDQGQVIGVTTASFVRGQNLNCAIASNEIKALMGVPPTLTTLKAHYEQTIASRIETIQPGILSVATSGDLYRYSYINDKGDLVGWEIEIIETIARNLSLAVSYVFLPFEETFASLHSQTDIVVNGMEYTPERERSGCGMASISYATILDEWGAFSPVFYVDKENPALLEAINQQIKTMLSDGTIDAIIKKYPPD